MLQGPSLHGNLSRKYCDEGECSLFMDEVSIYNKTSGTSTLETSSQFAMGRLSVKHRKSESFFFLYEVSSRSVRTGDISGWTQSFQTNSFLSNISGDYEMTTDLLHIIQLGSRMVVAGEDRLPIHSTIFDNYNNSQWMLPPRQLNCWTQKREEREETLVNFPLQPPPSPGTSQFLSCTARSVNGR